MLCTPDELIDRLDAYGPGTVALYEIVRWYQGAATRREDERIADLAPRALRGDQAAEKELNELIGSRAARNGTEPQTEIRRAQQRVAARKDWSAPVHSETPREGSPSVTDRMRKRDLE